MSWLAGNFSYTFYTERNPRDIFVNHFILNHEDKIVTHECIFNCSKRIICISNINKNKFAKFYTLQQLNILSKANSLHYLKFHFL